MSRLRIATRGSQLALWQANEVARLLRRADPSVQVDLNVVRTTGDRVVDVALARIGERGLFTKEVDAAVLAGEAELAVHSLKDVPTQTQDGLDLAAITRREDPRDVLLCREGLGPSLDELPTAARVGTSALRRRSQMLHRRQDLAVADLRGNLNTRLARLDRGEYDAIVLAAAGVLRLGWQDRISSFLEAPDWLPAPGQGALAVVVASGASAVTDLVARLHDAGTAALVTAERAFLRAIEGGCQVPVGALAGMREDAIVLDALIADLEGRMLLRARGEGSPAAAEELGRDVAAELQARGADRILDEARRAAAGAVPRVAAP